MFILAPGTIGTTATAFAQTDEEEETELGEEGIEILDGAVHERFPPEEG